MEYEGDTVVLRFICVKSHDEIYDLRFDPVKRVVPSGRGVSGFDNCTSNGEEMKYTTCGLIL